VLLASAMPKMRRFLASRAISTGGLRRQSEKHFPRSAPAFLWAWRGYPGKGLLAILIPTPMLMPSGRSLIGFIGGPNASNVPSRRQIGE
jgi:hypothetical protein